MPNDDGLPFVVVQVPSEGEDALFPSRFMWHGGRRGWTHKLPLAEKLGKKEAKRAANRLGHYSKNCVAFAIPLPVAWALLNGEPARWSKNKAPKVTP